MNFIDKLRETAEDAGSIVCMGLDPVLEKIPLKGPKEDVIAKFYTEILDAAVSEDVRPGMVKPNIAFYEQYGFEGLRALKKIIDAYRSVGILVLLDCKRADIGKTSAAYARAVFEFWKADAVTTAPYMGSDSVGPFTEYCSKGKGVYTLCRTSNKGAADFQNLKSGGKPLYMKTAQKIVEWHRPGIGAVVGATYPKELEKISEFFVFSGKSIPLLIPGVGAQGGSAGGVARALKNTGNELKIHRINSSSGINYAYKRFDTDDFAGAAVKAIRELNREIGKV
jgi:orotidine-5'-phosphate decarboxylase